MSDMSRYRAYLSLRDAAEALLQDDTLIRYAGREPSESINKTAFDGITEAAKFLGYDLVPSFRTSNVDA